MEELAGAAKQPPIVVPVEITLVPPTVRSLSEACSALRNAAHVCTLLSNQQTLVRNTFCLRVAMVQQLLTSVIPLPLPPNAEEAPKGSRTTDASGAAIQYRWRHNLNSYLLIVLLARQRSQNHFR